MPFLCLFLVFVQKQQQKKKQIWLQTAGAHEKFQVPLLTAHKDTDLLSRLKTLPLSLCPFLCQALPKTLLIPPIHTPHRHTLRDASNTARPRSLVLNEDLKDLFPTTY